MERYTLLDIARMGLFAHIGAMCKRITAVRHIEKANL
jgi:hypothetical protein